MFENLLIATILFLVTAASAYSLYYVLVGRHFKARRNGPASDREDVPDGPQDADRQTGISKDSYCYPKINDTMGYEFVKVIQIGAAHKEKEEMTWDKSTSTIMSPTRPVVMTRGLEDEMDNDEPAYRGTETSEEIGSSDTSASDFDGNQEGEEEDNYVVRDTDGELYASDVDELKEMNEFLTANGVPMSPAAASYENEDIIRYSRGLEEGAIIEDVAEPDERLFDALDHLQSMTFEQLTDDRDSDENERRAQELMTRIELEED